LHSQIGLHKKDTVKHSNNNSGNSGTILKHQCFFLLTVTEIKKTSLCMQQKTREKATTKTVQ
jgi:hypothetical protein